MNTTKEFVSYTLAMMAGVSFIFGLAILTNEAGL